MWKKLLLLVMAWSGLDARADPRQDVLCREVAFSRSAEARDAAAFREFIDADARFASSAVLRGPDEIVAGWQPFLGAGGPAIRWRPQVVEVLEADGLALTRGPYLMREGAGEGGAELGWGMFNSVWRRGADGHWRVLFDAGSPGAGELPASLREVLEVGPDCG
ncbi:YybH family protein [Haliea sp. E17]|uniref:YybH family protein n=1 Tax=Haliea sp. E17 TaxID=3401576 RepID=UPI003AAEFEAA